MTRITPWNQTNLPATRLLTISRRFFSRLMEESFHHLRGEAAITILVLLVLGLVFRCMHDRGGRLFSRLKIPSLTENSCPQRLPGFPSAIQSLAEQDTMTLPASTRPCCQYRCRMAHHCPCCCCQNYPAAWPTYMSKQNENHVSSYSVPSLLRL
jgi:hypothetical protein